MALTAAKDLLSLSVTHTIANPCTPKPFKPWTVKGAEFDAESEGLFWRRPTAVLHFAREMKAGTSRFALGSDTAVDPDTASSAGRLSVPNTSRFRMLTIVAAWVCVTWIILRSDPPAAMMGRGGSAWGFDEPTFISGA